MIRSFLPFLILISSLSPLIAQDGPESYSVERYAVIWKNSMFPRQPAGKKEDKGIAFWRLAGVFTYDSAKRAVIINGATGAVEEIEFGKKNKSGLTLLEVVENLETGTIGVKVDQKGKAFWVTKQPTKKEPEARPSGTESMMAGAQDDRKSVAVQ